MIELTGCEAVLLREIADRTLRQQDVAKTYRLAMESSESLTMDWRRVNDAIITRWSVSGLQRIKQMAVTGNFPR